MSYKAQGSPHNRELGIHDSHSEMVRVLFWANSLALGSFPYTTFRSQELTSFLRDLSWP